MFLDWWSLTHRNVFAWSIHWPTISQHRIVVQSWLTYRRRGTYGTPKLARYRLHASLPLFEPLLLHRTGSIVIMTSMTCLLWVCRTLPRFWPWTLSRRLWLIIIRRRRLRQFHTCKDTPEKQQPINLWVLHWYITTLYAHLHRPHCHQRSDRWPAWMATWAIAMAMTSRTGCVDSSVQLIL